MRDDCRKTKHDDDCCHFFRGCFPIVVGPTGPTGPSGGPTGAPLPLSPDCHESRPRESYCN